MKIGFIGGGNMGEALIKGLLRNGSSQNSISFIERNPERSHYLKQKYPAVSEISIKEIAQKDILIFAVKPQSMRETCEELRSYVNPKTIIVSIAAGLSLSFFEIFFPENPRVRVMPNTPALIGEGMSALCFSENCSPDAKERVRSIFENSGETIFVDESQMDIITALSGSGPAYFYLFIDCFAKAAPSLGLSFEQARKIMTQTMLGSARMLEDLSRTPEELMRQVMSPGGTTEAAIQSFQAEKIPEIIAKAVNVAVQRAEELRKKA